MRTPRIVISGDPPDTGVVSISGPPFIHLVRVLRRVSGDPVEVVFRASNHTYQGKIVAIEATQVTVELSNRLECAAVSRLTIFCGICKPKTLDFITAKAVELAISNLCFFEGAHSQASLKASRIIERLERLDRVADSALEQSGSQSAGLSLTICNNLNSALELFHSESKMFGQESRLLLQTPKPQGSQAITIIEYLTKQTDSSQIDPKISDSSLQSADKPAESYLVIGPEGGLAESEETLAIKQFGYVPVSLGPKALRVETAVIAAGAIAGLVQQRK